MKRKITFCVTFLITWNYAVNSQVIYTDVNPDKTVKATTVNAISSYFLNLNNDAIVDFVIGQEIMDAYTGYFVAIIAMDNNMTPNENEFIGNLNDHQRFHPFALNSNTVIDNTQTLWSNVDPWYPMLNMYINGIGGSAGYWIGVTDKYVGLRFKISGQWHYGWARLDIPVNASYFIIKDYAYESTPDKGIIAGDMGTGIDETTVNKSIKLYPNPSNGLVNLEIKTTSNKSVNIEITNINGQIVYKKQFNNSTQQQIDLTNQPKGMYFVKVQGNDVMKIEKIIIE